MDEDPRKTKITKETYGELLTLHDVDNSEDIRNEQTRPIKLQVGDNMKLKKRGWKIDFSLIIKNTGTIGSGRWKSSRSRVMLDKRVVM